MADRRNPFLRWIQYFLELLLLLFLSLIAYILPWALVWRIGRGLGWLVAVAAPVRERVLLRNLELAYPDMILEERLKLGRRCYLHWGESFVATLKLWFLSPEKIQTLVDAPELREMIRESRSSNRPILFFTGHFGSWEMAGRYVVDVAPGGSSIYRVQKNPLAEWFLTRIRNRRGMRLIPSGEGMEAFQRGLFETGCLAVVGDQFKPRNATEVDFFGIPSPSPKGAAILAQRTGAQLVFLASRFGRGRCRIIVENVPYDRPESPNEDWIQNLIQDLTRRLEEEIRRSPEQYFWFHKKWRREGRRQA